MIKGLLSTVLLLCVISTAVSARPYHDHLRRETDEYFRRNYPNRPELISPQGRREYRLENPPVRGGGHYGRYLRNRNRGRR